MTYKIEKGVPTPPIIGSGPERQALDKLKPSESILFPPGKPERSALNAASNKAAKNRDWTFTTQKQPDGSRRIWRLT